MIMKILELNKKGSVLIFLYLAIIALLLLFAVVG
jgi:hypothetical protein